MDSKCAICGKHSDLFSLRFDADETDAGKSWTTHVCGTCWEVIAAIARRACKIAGTAPDSPAGGQWPVEGNMEMGKIYWREFVDTFVGHGVYKTGLNHGADITSAEDFEQDMMELETLDAEFASNVRHFMKVAVIVPGHYDTSGYAGPSRVWWQIPPVYSPSYKWLGDPQHERKFARYRAA